MGCDAMQHDSCSGSGRGSMPLTENGSMDPMASPAHRLTVAQPTLALAMRLSGAVRARQITESIYLRPIKVETGGTGVHLPAHPDGTKDDLLAGIDNIVLAALCAAAITTGEVLQRVFGPAG